MIKRKLIKFIKLSACMCVLLLAIILVIAFSHPDFREFVSEKVESITELENDNSSAQSSAASSKDDSAAKTEKPSKTESSKKEPTGDEDLILHGNNGGIFNDEICSNCGGSGKAVCPSCFGSGSGTSAFCKTCYGDGKIQCQYCD